MIEDVKVGTVVELQEHEIKVIDALHKNAKTAQAMLWEATRAIEHARDKMWDAVHEMYPELKGFDLNLNHKRNEIVVTGVRFEDD